MIPVPVEMAEAADASMRTDVANAEYQRIKQQEEKERQAGDSSSDGGTHCPSDDDRQEDKLLHLSGDSASDGGTHRPTDDEADSDAMDEDRPG